MDLARGGRGVLAEEKVVRELDLETEEGWRRSRGERGV